MHFLKYTKANDKANQFITMYFECHWHTVKSSNGHIIFTLPFRTLSLTLFVVYVSRSRYIMYLAVKEFICNTVISYA